MGTVIGLGLLLWLLYLAYRDGRRAFGRSRPSDRALEQLEDVAPTDAHAAAETLAEERETALTHQLLAGAVEPSIYQRLMSELAHDVTHPGGRQP